MAVNPNFEKLLEPSSIGKVKTRNRIIKTGASQMYWNETETRMNNMTRSFYEAIAKGGVGLLIVESPTVHYPYGARWFERYRIDDDKYIPGLAELADLIHKQGCPTFLQFNHDGPWQSPLFANYPATFEGPPIGASPVNLPVPGDFHRDKPRALTIPEIEDITDKVASAAVRAKKAGFDGLDINAASSHLFHNFLSPYWNRRQDEYGGSVENRARFILNVLREIKRRNGPDFPVMICINGIEVGQAAGLDNRQCLTFADSKKIAQMLQEAGADAIHLRSHWLGYHAAGFLPDHLFFPEPPVPLNEFPKEYDWSRRGAGANLILSGEFKKFLKIPIMVVGRFDAALGEKALREGKADFIAMHRRLIADPEYPNKIAQGRMEEIAPCTACLTCLDQSLGKARHCRINARLATDKTYDIGKAAAPKKIVVVGGGPAGMEAARVAALMGHNVTLYEKSAKLGGLLPLASLIKGPEIEDLPAIIRYFEVQLKKLGVKIELGKEFQPVLVDELKPDVVIVATGGTLTVPPVKGIENRKVMTTPALHQKVKPFLKLFGPKTLGWLTKFYLPIGKRVVIIGTGLHGCETAEFLIKRGRQVTLVDTAEVPGVGMIDVKFGALMGWFGRKGVTLINGAKSIEITDQGVEIVTKEGEKKTLEADSIVPTSPLQPNLELALSLEGKGPKIYAIGDCQNPKMIVDAISAGMWTIRNL